MNIQKQIWVLLLAIVLAGITSLSAQEKKNKQEQKEETVNQLIASKKYKIEVSTAMPMQGRTIPLTSPYSLEIKNDSVFSYLPYYGRAYSIPYGGGQGLNFKAPLESYTLTLDKKGNYNIQFSARTSEDRYEFRTKVFTNGASSIDVTMQNRQGITFSGELNLDKR